MKKTFILCLVFTLIVGSLGSVFGETGSLIYGERLDGYELEVDHPTLGRMIYLEPIKYIDQRVAWCLQMYAPAYEDTGYDTAPPFDYISPELSRDLELIVHTAWTLTPKRYEDYFVTSLLLWERLGYSFSPTFAGTTRPNPDGLQYYDYPTRKAEIFALVEQYKQVSSLHGQELTLKVGESIVLEDTSGVLEDLLEQSAPLKHTSFERSGNRLTITGLSPGHDTYVFDRFNSQHLGTTLYWKNSSDFQDIATFEITAPMETSFQVSVIEPKGSIRVLKQGALDAALAGVEFSLIDSSGSVIAGGVTDQQGVLELVDLPYGNYQLEEITTPAGYLSLSEPVDLSVDREAVIEVIIQNEPTRVEVLKTDPEGNPLPGAQLQLQQASGEMIDEWISGSGPKTWLGLAPGPYRVVELKAPTGYQPTDPMSFDVVLQADTQTFRMIDQVGIGQVEISKVDISTSQPLPDTKISLYHHDGREIDGKITDENGLAVFDQLEVGQYYFIETQAPEGYLLNDSKHHFEITDHGQIIKAELPNQIKMGIPVVTKVELEAERPLSGAVIELYNSEGDLLQTRTTDESGVARYAPIAYGRYYLLEKEAPEGHVVNPFKHWFRISHDQEEVDITISDQLIYAQPVITKRSQETNLPLAGVEFALYSEEGKLIDTGTTDETGRLEFQEQPYGSYYYVETKTVEGYVLNQEKQWFDITNDRVVVLSALTNRLIYSTPTITKLDISTEDPLPDTRIELYDQDDQLIEEQITDEAGFASFRPVPYGRYYFLEKEAPKGYVLNPEKHWFEVRTDGETIPSTMTNEMIRGQLQLTKQDTETEERLKGAVFELRHDDEVVGRYTTDQAGKIELELCYGEYRMVEITAPDGYEVDQTVIEFAILHQDELVEMVVDNQSIKETLPKTGIGSSSGMLMLPGILILIGIYLRKK